MKHINEAIAGLSFLGLLSASGYAEMDKLPMGGYTVLAALLLGVMLISVRSLVNITTRETECGRRRKNPIFCRRWHRMLACQMQQNAKSSRFYNHKHAKSV